MNGETLRNILRFILLVFFQLFVLNNIYFGGFINPYPYILFIMLLPFETASWLVIFLAFVTGLIIDTSSVTIGYHTVSTVLAAYLRFHLLRFLCPRDGYESNMQPTIRSMGFAWFFKYVFPLTIVHHLTLFWIESFQLNDLLPATLRAIASTIFTLLLIIFMQYFTTRRNRHLPLK